MGLDDTDVLDNTESGELIALGGIFHNGTGGVSRNCEGRFNPCVGIEIAFGIVDTNAHHLLTGVIGGIFADSYGPYVGQLVVGDVPGRA